MTEQPFPELAVPPPPRPRPRPSLTPDLMTRLADAGSWARNVGTGMIVFGALAALPALLVIRGGAPLLALNNVYIALSLIIPGAFLRLYGKRIQLACDDEPATNVTIAFGEIRRFWISIVVFSLLSLLFIPLLAMPNFRTAMARSKLRRTFTDMKTVAGELDEYAVLHHAYPKAANSDELMAMLHRQIPTKDAWDHPFNYRAACEEETCFGYELSSTPPVDDPSQPAAELVIVNGRLVKGPKAWVAQ